MQARPFPMKKVLPLLILAGSAALSVTLLATEPPIPVRESVRSLPVVRVVEAKPQRETLEVRSQGVLAPRSQLQLAPEVDGRVTWVNPALVAGGQFRRGDTLLQIDQQQYLSRQQQAEAKLESAGIEYNFAEEERDRVHRLHEKQLVSTREVDERERQFALARAELSLAESALADALRDLENTRISAPFDGRVQQEGVEPGQFVKRGEALATVYARDVLEVRLPIPEHELQHLLPADATAHPAVDFSADYAGGSVSFRGELVRMEAELDTRSNMLFAVAEIHSDQLPFDPPLGLFVDARIHGREIDNVVRLHRRSLRNGNQVLLVDADNRLRLPVVEVLRRDGDYVLISAGLPPDARVCDSHIDVVVDGMEVEAVSRDGLSLSAAR